MIMKNKIMISDLKCISENIDLDSYISFKDKVKQKMEYPDWLGDFSKEDLKKMIKEGSKIWVYYLEDEPVCSMMLIPATDKSLNKFEIDLDYKQVMDYGPMMVNPNYIGNNLQYQMLKQSDSYSFNKGYKYALSTVHPENIYSINNLLKDNFEFISQKELKRGVRNVYLKKFK